MPPLDSAILTLLASVATVITQLVKGLLPEKVKPFLPLMIFAVLVPIGVALALYYQRDPVAGALEGLFGFAAAVGFYETANVIPGAKTVFNAQGWIAPKEQKS